MEFFKHFTDANNGKSLRRVRRSLGMAGVGQYWALVEMCAKKLRKEPGEEYNEAHCVFEFDLSHVADNLGTKPKQVRNILEVFQECDLIKFITEDYIVRIEMPKLLESLDRDSRRARQGRAQTAPKRKNKEKEEEKEKEFKESTIVDSSPVAQKKHSGGHKSPRETFEILEVVDLVSLIDPQVHARWNRLYSPEYVEREMLKMVNYLVSNPAKNKKTKRGLSLFAGNWLDRGWAKHQAKSPGQAESGVMTWLKSQKEAAG